MEKHPELKWWSKYSIFYKSFYSENLPSSKDNDTQKCKIHFHWKQETPETLNYNMCRGTVKDRKTDKKCWWLQISENINKIHFNNWLNLGAKPKILHLKQGNQVCVLAAMPPLNLIYYEREGGKAQLEEESFRHAIYAGSILLLRQDGLCNVSSPATTSFS